MREPLCICWALDTSAIVSRAGAGAAFTGGATEGATEEPVRPVPAPVFVVDVVAEAVAGASGLLTLLPISKDAKEKKR
jgi:hypothetical protein